MIERFIVSELGIIAALNGQCYPVAAPIGELEGNFCIYTRVSGTVERDMSGEPVFYRDVYRIDLFGDDTDELFSLECAVIDGLKKENVDFENLYIFSAEAEPGEPDGYDLTIVSFLRSIIYSVTYWR